MKMLFAFVFWLFPLVCNAGRLVPVAQSRKEKVLICDDSKTQRVNLALGRITILTFPVTPKKIIPGENSFDFQQIKNDLAIKALRAGAKTNVFVYMAERRCAFDLVTTPSGGDDIIFIRDPKDRQMEVNFK